MKKIIIVILVFSLYNSCNPAVQKWFLKSEDVQVIENELVDKNKRRPDRPGKGRDCCKDKLNYIPDTAYLDHTPMRYINMNFHMMNSEDSSQLFDETKGVKFVKDLIRAAEHRIRNNKQMFLPPGNTTPVVPPRYRFRIAKKPGDPTDDGVYFHYDDDLYFMVNKGKNRNNYNRDVYKKYGIQKDTVLNAFIQPLHPDSVKSATYKNHSTGIALGPFIKVAGDFKGGKMRPDLAQKYFNHEVGHIYGLSHTWSYKDGCDDTPNHPNCWNDKTSPECDSLASNNFMDYNAYQSAWSPCQIGKMHYNFSNPRFKRRNYLKKTWCRLHNDRHIFIKDSIHWKSMKDLEGHLTIEKGGSLQISCRVSFPKGAKITVMPGGKLILDNCLLHNDCGDKWQGIEIQQVKKDKGVVEFWGEPVIEDVENAIR